MVCDVFILGFVVSQRVEPEDKVTDDEGVFVVERDCPIHEILKQPQQSSEQCFSASIIEVCIPGVQE